MEESQCKNSKQEPRGRNYNIEHWGLLRIDMLLSSFSDIFLIHPRPTCIGVIVGWHQWEIKKRKQNKNTPTDLLSSHSSDGKFLHPRIPSTKSSTEENDSNSFQDKPSPFSCGFTVWIDWIHLDSPGRTTGMIPQRVIFGFPPLSTYLSISVGLPALADHGSSADCCLWSLPRHLGTG